MSASGKIPTQTNPSASMRRQSLAIAVAGSLRQAIGNGEYPIGARLPAEPSLAAQTGVSRATLREALRVLESEGLVVRRQRTGTVVTGRPVPRNSLEQNYSVRDVIEAAGERHGIRDASLDFVESDSRVSKALAIEVGSPVAVLTRTVLADGDPAAVTVDYVALSVVESAAAPILPNIQLYDWFRESCGINIAFGVAVVAARLANDQICGRLLLDPPAPALHLEQVDYTRDGLPVLYAMEVHRPDRFEMRVVRNGPHV